jgi:predicted protein tyrosine phosphatase
MLRILFVCSMNRLRSPTAEHVFAELPGVETASAGVNRDADEPVSGELLAWADLVVAMEAVHRRKLARGFAAELKNKRVVTLGVPDDFEYMDPALVALLKIRMAGYLP